jgi:predicted metal-dependent peptidase
MNKLQQAITALLFSEPFYGHLISKMHISQSSKVPTAGVFITDKINLIYNEKWIEEMELFDVVKVLKHECGHILQEHIPRAKRIGIVNNTIVLLHFSYLNVTIGQLLPVFNEIDVIS